MKRWYVDAGGCKFGGCFIFVFEKRGGGGVGWVFI